MQKYSTIIGVIELRQDGIGYRTISSRYSIGSSVITLIMNRFKELGFTLEELRIMNNTYFAQSRNVVIPALQVPILFWLYPLSLNSVSSLSQISSLVI